MIAGIALVLINKPARALDDRALAATCAACHGTQGRSVGGMPVLAGINSGYFIKQMDDFRSGARPATVMHRHARGYTDLEITAMARFFAAQKKPNP